MLRTSTDGRAVGIPLIPVSPRVAVTAFIAFGKSTPMFFLMAELKIGKMPTVPIRSQTKKDKQ